MADNVPLAMISTEQPEDIAGVDFPPAAHWEFMQPNYDCIDSKNQLIVNGVQYRDPTTPVGMSCNIVKKYNYSETFDHPPFLNTVLLPKQNICQNLMKDRAGNQAYKQGHTTQTVPNIEFTSKHGLNLSSHPLGSTFSILESSGSPSLYHCLLQRC